MVEEAVSLIKAVRLSINNEEKLRYLAEMQRQNPQLRGASVEDFLSMMEDHDTHLALIDKMVANLKDKSDAPLVAHATRIIACSYNEEGCTWKRVEDLVNRIKKTINGGK